MMGTSASLKWLPLQRTGRLVGDFNAKHSACLSSQDTDIAGMRMFAFAATNGLSQTVSEPTYSTVSGNEVPLNFMFTNQPGLVQSFCVLPPVSDHCPTVLTLQAQHYVKPSHPSKGYSTWNYAGADYASLREAFRQVDWSSLEKFPDPTEAVPCGINLPCLFFELLHLSSQSARVHTASHGTALICTDSLDRGIVCFIVRGVIQQMLLL